MNDLALLYDEQCPFCDWYTSWFVKLGVLKKEGRVSFQQALKSEKFQFDEDRARDEIALIDFDVKLTRYGADSLLNLLGRKWKWMEVVGNQPVVYSMIKFLYNLISLNRKIIAGSRCNGVCDCEPNFRLPWRLLFITLISCCSMMALLNGFESSFILLHTTIDLHIMWLPLIALVVQGGVVTVFNQYDKINYLGHLAFILLMMSIGANALSYAIDQVHVIIGVVVGVSILMHYRRRKNLGLTYWLDVVWVGMWLIIMNNIV